MNRYTDNIWLNNSISINDGTIYLNGKYAKNELIAIFDNIIQMMSEDLAAVINKRDHTNLTPTAIKEIYAKASEGISVIKNCMVNEGIITKEQAEDDVNYLRKRIRGDNQ